jgi:GNAT superfamily N-acetyltransferase
VGIERELQGQGIGSLLLREFCRIVDSEEMTGWLETDKEVNISFYRKHGFEVVGEDIVNGVRNWFMERKTRTLGTAQQSAAANG